MNSWVRFPSPLPAPNHFSNMVQTAFTINSELQMRMSIVANYAVDELFATTLSREILGKGDAEGDGSLLVQSLILKKGFMYQNQNHLDQFIAPSPFLFVSPTYKLHVIVLNAMPVQHFVRIADGLIMWVLHDRSTIQFGTKSSRFTKSLIQMIKICILD